MINIDDCAICSPFIRDMSLLASRSFDALSDCEKHVARSRAGSSPRLAMISTNTDVLMATNRFRNQGKPTLCYYEHTIYIESRNNEKRDTELG